MMYVSSHHLYSHCVTYTDTSLSDSEDTGSDEDSDYVSLCEDSARRAGGGGASSATTAAASSGSSGRRRLRGVGRRR